MYAQKYGNEPSCASGKISVLGGVTHKFAEKLKGAIGRHGKRNL
jgi:hypothetical protein